MSESDWLNQKFQENQTRLRSVAYRILGSRGEAEDAVQEAWLRLTGSDVNEVENLSAWLTTVVSRICLDMLRSRKSKSEAPIEEVKERAGSANPERDTLLADSLGPALLLVLESLTPTERVAFVLHDVFDLSFEEIAPILGKSAMATRQLASRARRRVQGAKDTADDSARKKEIVSAFLKASREGDFTALLQLLDPQIILRADATAVKVSTMNRDKGAPAFEPEMRGSQIIAGLFKGKAAGAVLAQVDGEDFGATWIMGGKPRVLFAFTVQDGLISEVDIVMNPEDLDELEIKAV